MDQPTQLGNVTQPCGSSKHWCNNTYHPCRRGCRLHQVGVVCQAIKLENAWRGAGLAYERRRWKTQDPQGRLGGALGGRSAQQRAYMGGRQRPCQDGTQARHCVPRTKAVGTRYAQTCTNRASWGDDALFDEGKHPRHDARISLTQLARAAREDFSSCAHM